MKCPVCGEQMRKTNIYIPPTNEEYYRGETGREVWCGDWQCGCSYTYPLDETAGEIWK